MVTKKASRGFTLIELLVVMAILGALLLIVPPMFATSLSTASLKAATRDVAAGLRQARSDAIVRNREIPLVVDVEAGRLTIGDDASPKSLSPDITLTLHTAESERVSDTVGRIRFFPDGSSTGGGITLERDDRKYHVTVDWLTGQISIAE